MFDFMKKFSRICVSAAAAILIVAAMKLPDYSKSVIGTSATESTSVFTLSDIPEYSGIASVAVNNNEPFFTSDEIETAKTSFENYSELDNLGRCGVAVSSVSTDTMPTTERGSISSIKSSGWVQNKYPGIVDSNPPYLYNRCHLIAYMLTGENANEKNLITGTRYMNIEGMYPYEHLVANYIESYGGHVLYRVTPIYEGDNLLASGVLMEALSVEDNGAGLKFNAYCYNVQDGVTINYATGENYASDAKATATDTYSETTSNDTNVTTQSDGTSSNNTANNNHVIAGTSSNNSAGSTAANENEQTYVLNKNTHKFHYPSCSSVSKMKESNKEVVTSTRDEIIAKGYDPCKNCNP